MFVCLGVCMYEENIACVFVCRCMYLREESCVCLCVEGYVHVRLVMSMPACVRICMYESNQPSPQGNVKHSYMCIIHANTQICMQIDN